MNNETKRDVFEELLDEWQVDETMPDANWKYPDFKLVRIKEERFKDRYSAALPDDLPVIPKIWGDTIEEFKDNHYRLSEIFTEWDWNYDEQELIARAWLLGVWRVEETGEVVKL